MIGKYATNVGLIGNAANPRIYYVPLQFWFKYIEPKSNTLIPCGLWNKKTVRNSTLNTILPGIVY